MGEKETYTEQMEGELVKCQTRVDDIRTKLRSKHDVIPPEVLEEIDGLEGELRSCQLVLDDLKDKQDVAWQDAKQSIVKKYDSLKRNLDLTTRRII